MDRKATAKETLNIIEQGYYELDGKRIDISGDMERSIEQSFLLTPKQGEELLEKYSTSKNTGLHMSITSDILRGHTDAIILSHLLEKDSYGYQINKDIMKKTGSRYELKEATLYSAFRRLEQAGYIRTYDNLMLYLNHVRGEKH